MQEASSSAERNRLHQRPGLEVPAQHGQWTGASVRASGPAMVSVADDASGPRAGGAGPRGLPDRTFPSWSSEARVDAIRNEGFTERQATFLAIVMLHGGVCMVRQYCAFAGIAHGHNAREFFARLVSVASPLRTPPCMRGRGFITSTIGGCTPLSGSRIAASESRCRRGAPWSG